MAAQRPWRQYLALAGAAEAAWFLGFSLVLGWLRAGYDPTHDAISRLGEQGSASPSVWNLGGFGVAALLYLLYAVPIRDAFGTGAFFAATVLQALTIAGSAAFSCDTGCPPVPVSTAGFLHAVFGLPYFAITCLAPFLASRAFRGREEWLALTTASLVIGLLLAGLFLAGPSLGADRVGLWQRLVLVPALMWQAVVSLRLYRMPARHEVRPSQSINPGGLAQSHDGDAPLRQRG